MAVVPPVVAVISAAAFLSGVSTDLSLFIPAALAWLLQMVVMVLASRRYEVSAFYALTTPLGLALMYAMLFDSSIRITTGRGVTWKGRRIYERQGVPPPRLRTR